VTRDVTSGDPGVVALDGEAVPLAVPEGTPENLLGCHGGTRRGTVFQ
jgi:hypothetical protein